MEKRNADPKKVQTPGQTPRDNKDKEIILSSPVPSLQTHWSGPAPAAQVGPLRLPVALHLHGERKPMESKVMVPSFETEAATLISELPLGSRVVMLLAWSST